MKTPKTKKQRQFFQELPRSKTQTEAALKAGYSPSSAKVSASRNITKYNDFLFTILEKAEINTDSLAKAMKAGMKVKDPQLKLKYVNFIFKILERAFKSEGLPAEDLNPIPGNTINEATRSRLYAKLAAQKYTSTDIAFIRKSDMPKNIQQLSPEEVIDALGFDAAPKTHRPKSKRSLAEIARSRLPKDQPNEAK
jgi:hypothetical protein